MVWEVGRSLKYNLNNGRCSIFPCSKAQCVTIGHLTSSLNKENPKKCVLYNRSHLDKHTIYALLLVYICMTQSNTVKVKNSLYYQMVLYKSSIHVVT